jgi:hypothetical protein
MTALHHFALSSPYAEELCPQPQLPHLQELLRLWEDTARAARGLPSRRRFAFEIMRPWLGHVAIWTVEWNPLRFRAALIGLQLVEWEGQEGTGRYLDEVMSETHRSRALARYTHVATTGAWYADKARLRENGTAVAILHRLMLPCADDGVTVDAILTAIYRDA